MPLAPRLSAPGGEGIDKGGLKGTPMEIVFLCLFPLGLCALAGGMFLPPLLRNRAE